MKQSRLFYLISTLFIFTIFILTIVLFAAPSLLKAQTNPNNNVSGFAWSDNIGWISFNSSDISGAPSYGVNLSTSTGALSGYAWSDGLGWISFNQSSCGLTPNVNLTTGAVSGFADALTAGANGCVSLSGSQYGVTYDATNTQQFKGFAWGGDYIGWVSFNSKDDNNTGNYAVYGPGITQIKTCQYEGVCSATSTSPANVCGMTNTGTTGNYSCDANFNPICTPIVPAVPSNTLCPCISAPNNCGMTNTGYYDSTGTVCSAIPPPNYLCSNNGGGTGPSVPLVTAVGQCYGTSPIMYLTFNSSSGNQPITYSVTRSDGKNLGIQTSPFIDTSVSLGNAYNYLITASNAYGTAESSASSETPSNCNVNSGSVSIKNLTANPKTVDVGGTCTLSWIFNKVDSNSWCTLSQYVSSNNGGSPTLNPIYQFSATSVSSHKVSVYSAEQTYILKCGEKPDLATIESTSNPATCYANGTVTETN